jgi:predicted helicase
VPLDKREGSVKGKIVLCLALEQFRSHYPDPSITEWDIFHYIYAVLHHPEYRERNAANLRRELPTSSSPLALFHPVVTLDNQL